MIVIPHDLEQYKPFISKLARKRLDDTGLVIVD
jgi:hypothetical protein